MEVKTNDFFGANVNLAAHVVGENKGEQIWISSEAKGWT